MTILSGDIKLVASQVMDDVPEGGGAPTSTVIVDGTSNSIFPDISELDRAGGRINLRKVHVHVQTPDRDTYLGGNVVVAEPPQDPNVSITLFSTKDTFDRRNAAKSRIEAYLNKGPEWAGYLYENHIVGQRVIQMFQRPTDVLPNVGQTLALTWNEGESDEKEQYVRATKVASVNRTFTDTNGETYQANIVTLELSDTLRFDLPGSPASPYFRRLDLSTKVRDTVVADAGSYAGVVPLAQPASIGDFTIKTTSIYTQLVPSAQTETPVSFAPPYAAAGLPVPGVVPVTYTADHAWTSTINFSLPGGCLPGSLTINTAGVTIFDDAGLLKTTAGTLGTIDYANGVLVLNAGDLSGAKSITYTPAAQILRAPQSSEIPVTPESRSQSYVGTINPVPQPGTLSISYRAQGRWYVLSDAGNGTLKGVDAKYGAGTIDDQTGAFVVTLGALPDAGSSIVLTWNVPTQETKHPSATLVASQGITLTPPSGLAIQPGTLAINWTQDGAKTASVATNGVISGDGTGVLYSAKNFVDFAPNVLPAVGTQITFTYVAGPKHEDTFAHPSRDGTGKVPVTASLGAVEPGSLEVEWATYTSEAVLTTYKWQQLREMGIVDITNAARPVITGVDPTQIARDDGAGNLLLNGVNVGTVNYATGAVLFNPDVTVKIPSPRYAAVEVGTTWTYRLNYSGVDYVDAPSLYPNNDSGYVKLRYNVAGSTSSQVETFEFRPSFRLVPGVQAQVVPGTVLLSADGSQPWGDNGQGTLREFTTSGWVTRGSINYLSGTVALTSWSAGTTNSITRASCVTTVGQNISSEYVFRTSTAPLRPGSLSIQFARAVGGTQTVTAGTDGVISATGITGDVDHQSGLVRLRFGSKVTAAGNETEPWYSADAVDVDGKIFKPAPVPSASVRYSAVAYSYLPLDADLLGIDPVRLPTDGRVPIFRPGGFAVLGHTGKITATVSNGQTINCARVRLSRVRVVGANGIVIHTGYSADLDAGTVTFSAVAGYSQPVTIEHRIEDMAVVRDVQINGEISFTRPVTHAYPVPGSYVSGALMAGDLKSRVSAVFDQATWDGVTWKDTVEGNPATATYNDVLAPVVVTNAGAVAQRWALRFTSSTAFQCIGESVGVVGTGTINADFAPINPATGVPYFTIAALGWGTGWAAGNVLFVITVGAMYPVWVVRTVQQGAESVQDDAFTLLVRGDVDRP